jgi:hypothetical protein
MKTHTSKILLACAALGAAALFALPSVGTAFTTIGGSLGISTSGNGYQRDFRVFDNSTDATAHDNNAAESNHPGALGAVLAVWKGAESWNSSTTAAGRNFDFDFQGEAASVGGVNDNTVSWGSPSGCGGGVIAFMDPGSSPGISNGWQIRMCEGISWQDGPGTSFGGQDIQGIVSHEIGHALGLGHSNVGGCGGSCTDDATMCAFACGNSTNARSIASDDQSGLQSLYGSLPSNKPVITSLAGSFNPGQTLIINGSNFPSTVHVKFTAGTSTNTGAIPGLVMNVPASPTQVSVTIPGNAQDGNVLVWAASISRLSNPFPIDVGAAPPGPPIVSSVSPSEVVALNPGLITLSGSGFNGVTQVAVGGTTLTSGQFTIANDSQIQFQAPVPTTLGPVNVNVTDIGGTSNSVPLTYEQTDPLTLVAPPFLFNGQPATWSWGGQPNQVVFMLFNTSGATAPFKGTQLLVWDVLIPFPNTDGAGLGSLPVAMVSGLTSGLTIRAQILTADPGAIGFDSIELSNITASLVFF